MRQTHLRRLAASILAAALFACAACTHPTPATRPALAEARSLFDQADALRIGNGIHIDRARSLALFRQAAALGHPKAQERVGMAYRDGQAAPFDLTQALEWFHQAADLGDGEAMADIGWLYLRGDGLPQDSALAFQWIDRGAKTGDAVAIRTLSLAYDFGIGVPPDQARAVALLRKPPTSERLGHGLVVMCYIDGRGVPQDDARAQGWLAKAVETGDSSTLADLGVAASWVRVFPGLRPGPRVFPAGP